MRIVKKGLDATRKALGNLKKRLFPSALERVHATGDRIIKVMRTPGKPPTHPIQWDTERQKRAYFATNGFGGGIPTVRTDESPNAWKVIKTDRGADMSNPLSHAGYLYGTERGERQSRIHRGRHPIFRKIVDSMIARLPRSVRDRLVVVIRNEGFEVK